jgi:ABC-2 type transport system permease protein
VGAGRRIGAIARKEFIHISRDWRILVGVAVLPLVQLLLFAYAISFDVRNVPTVVYDSDNTAQSRSYIDAATNAGFFHVIRRVNSSSEIDRVFDRGEARVAIVIARGFGTAITAGGAARAAVLIDGSEPNSAELGRTYALALNNAFGRSALVSWSASS